MLRSLVLAAVAFVLAGAPSASADVPRLTVEAFVARHIAARGGAAALRSIRSIVFDAGVYHEGDTTSPGDAVMMLKRPYFKLVGHPLRQPGFMEGYDGAAWEWYGDPGITLRTVGAASAAGRHNTDVEGPFLDYADKGSRVELIGVGRIGENDAYQARLTMMDGYATDYFIDQHTFLVVASRHTAEVHAFGAPVTSETRYSDYRRVAGVMFPFRSSEVELATAREMNSMQWGTIVINTDPPDAWFSPPVYTRTPIQAFMEQLFVQRTDPLALLWTYRVFRRAHPEIDTHEASEVVGYQALKMGQAEGAIALLERNAADYPTIADSAFGLGRAYATAGRTADARTEFLRTLQIDPAHGRAKRALAALPR